MYTFLKSASISIFLCRYGIPSTLFVDVERLRNLCCWQLPVSMYHRVGSHVFFTAQEGVLLLCVAGIIVPFVFHAHEARPDAVFATTFFSPKTISFYPSVGSIDDRGFRTLRRQLINSKCHRECSLEGFTAKESQVRQPTRHRTF